MASQCKFTDKCFPVLRKLKSILDKAPKSLQQPDTLKAEYKQVVMQAQKETRKSYTDTTGSGKHVCYPVIKPCKPMYQKSWSSELDYDMHKRNIA